MNTLAISNHLVMRLLQSQNTKRVVAKKMNLFENREETNPYTSINIPPSILTTENQAPPPQTQPEPYNEVKIPIPMSAAPESAPCESEKDKQDKQVKQNNEAEVVSNL